MPIAACCETFLTVARQQPSSDTFDTCPTCKRRHFRMQPKTAPFTVKAHDLGMTGPVRTPLTVSDLTRALLKAPPDALVFFQKPGGYAAAMEAVLSRLNAPDGTVIQGFTIRAG